MGYRNVLVGTDGSETASIAVRHAAGLAAAFGARLTIVTAYFDDDSDTLARAREEAPEEIRWRITDTAAAEERATEAKALAREAGVKTVVVRVGRGEPAQVLIDLADETGADLIVMGSKGMMSPGRFLVGSVPNKVSHHAPCDIVIVHTAR